MMEILVKQIDALYSNMVLEMKLILFVRHKNQMENVTWEILGCIYGS